MADKGVPKMIAPYIFMVGPLTLLLLSFAGVSPRLITLVAAAMLAGVGLSFRHWSRWMFFVYAAGLVGRTPRGDPRRNDIFDELSALRLRLDGLLN
jgi:hypothetical protein